jgi:hypothetical protein
VAFKLNTYEGQAKLSLVLGVVGAAAAMVVMFLIWKKFDRMSFYVSYNAKGLFLPIFGMGVLGGLIAGTVGFFVALNSAGQRRNTRSKLSWQAFFLNAIVLTVLLATAVFFVFTRNAISLK